MRVRISALFLSVALSTVAVSAQSNQILAGTVSDAMCGAHHMIQGLTPAQCTRKCVKEGMDSAAATTLTPECASPLDDQDGQCQESCC
jgi:hypothetical protein